MRRGAALICLGWLVGTGLAAKGQDPAAPVANSPSSSPTSSADSAVINQYCVTCHNDRAKVGGLSLSGLDATNVASSAEVWEKVVRKLQTGSMPPQGARRPDAAAYNGLINHLAGNLDHLATAAPNPGRPLLHRLNRAEYANAIRDLLALDHVDV